MNLEVVRGGVILIEDNTLGIHLPIMSSSLQQPREHKFIKWPQWHGHSVAPWFSSETLAPYISFTYLLTYLPSN